MSLVADHFLPHIRIDVWETKVEECFLESQVSGQGLIKLDSMPNQGNQFVSQLFVLASYFFFLIFFQGFPGS